jgi:chromosomal replication initiator protein
MKVLIQDIQKVTAEVFAVPQSLLIEPSRQPVAVRPRHVAMFLSSVLTNRSDLYIASRFGRKDHTTVRNARRSIGSQLWSDRELATKVKTIIHRVAA